MDDDETAGLSKEEIEEWRLNEMIGPLFDMMLKFEKAFTRKAIDIIGMSDEDAEAASQLFLKGEDGKPTMGVAFAYFLQRIRGDRVMRELGKKFAAVHNGDELLSFAEIEERYRKLEEQGKIGKA